MADEPAARMRDYRRRATVTKDHFHEVFHCVHKMRAMGVDRVSAEEMQFLFFHGPEYKETLWQLVCMLNDATVHPSIADFMGDLQLLGIEKRNEENEVVGTRPIGIPSVLRRLAGRVLMQAYSEAMGEFFTTTPVPPELLVAAGHAAAAARNGVVRIDVSGGKRYQQVYGIGTSLEASTDYNLHLLGPEARASLLSDLFDPDVGIGMTLGRVTIATSDFTPLPFYSYDDLADPNATDNNLTHFSVERDAGSTFGQ